MVCGRPRLRADRREKDEALGAGALRCARKRDRRLGVEHAIIVLRQSRHGVGDAGGVNDGVDVGERGRHVLRARQVADDCAGGLHRHRARPSQQHAQPIAALGQFAQQMLPDEAGRAGKRDEGFAADRVHRCSGPFAGCVPLRINIPQRPKGKLAGRRKSFDLIWRCQCAWHGSADSNRIVSTL